jgi:hypothetical protein
MKKASGQKLNKEKTFLFFSRNTSTTKREEITQCSRLKATEKYEKYLGLPTLVGRSRLKAFKGIKDKVWVRLNDLKVQFLSQAGKEILIKAVIQAIPTYCMECFSITSGFMQGAQWPYAKVLVGAQRKYFEDSLDEVEKNGSLKIERWYGV